jgi:hypothetical protein
MNRCPRTLARFGLAACLALTGLWLSSPTAALSQGITREAPKDVVAGQMTVTAPPVITIDGKPERLSPGSRIHDLNNMLVLSGNIVGKVLPVVYRREPAGLVHEVWILTPDEYSKLGGIKRGDPEGYKRFNELLAIIFGTRK